MTARIRFAPSPTGNLHIGTLRTALFNWIYSKATGATFVLRIEDTDLSRSQPVYETNIMEGLEWLGLTVDEGPTQGGDYGPYRQSERIALGIYERAAETLLEKGLAYRCVCSEAELDAERAEAEAAKRPYVYSGKCRKRSAAEIDSLIAEGKSATVKFHVPAGESVAFDDIIRGEIAFDTGLIGDFVLVKSDGTPSYNFAVVVDDSMMAITHVIRGEDHISNTPKQILLFEALGAAVPRFAHLPMILGPDKSKLSKRHGATGVTEYRNQGYMADAMFNYLTLLGWSSPSGTEILSREEITPQFALDRVSKSGAVFDITKLNWMNGQYIRRQTPESLWRLTQPFISSEMTARLSGYSDEQKQAIVMSVRDNLDLLTDIDRFIQVYGWTESEFQDQIKSGQALGTGDRTVLAAFRGAIEEIEWSPATIDQAVLDVVTATGLGKGKVFKPIRLGVSAAGSGPHLGDLIYLLGRERVMGRLDFVLETLGVKE